MWFCFSQGSWHHHRHWHYLWLSGWNGRGLSADDGACEKVPIPKPLHQPVLPTSRNSGGQDGAGSGACGERLGSKVCILIYWLCCSNLGQGTFFSYLNSRQITQCGWMCIKHFKHLNTHLFDSLGIAMANVNITTFQSLPTVGLRGILLFGFIPSRWSGIGSKTELHDRPHSSLWCLFSQDLYNQPSGTLTYPNRVLVVMDKPASLRLRDSAHSWKSIWCLFCPQES